MNLFPGVRILSLIALACFPITGCNSTSQPPNDGGITSLSAPSLALQSGVISGYDPHIALVVSNLQFGQATSVTVYADALCTTTLATAKLSPWGYGNATLQLTFSHPGVSSFSATVENANGASPCSSSVTYSLLSVPSPTGLALLSPASSPSRDTSPVLRISGATVGDLGLICTDSTCTQILGSATATGPTVDVRVTTPLSIGTQLLYAQFMRGGGKSQGVMSGVSYTVLTPVPPTSLTLQIPVSSPGWHTRPMIRVSGEVYPGYLVNLYKDNSCLQSVGAHSASASASADVVTSELTPGAYSFYAKTTYGGITTACSTAFAAYTLSTHLLMASAQHSSLQIQGTTLSAIGDFNGDGKKDILTAGVNFSDTGGVRFAPGNGDGTFGAASLVGAQTAVGGLAVGDFNGDGKADFVIHYGRGGSSSLKAYLGNGDGTFTPGAQIAAFSTSNIYSYAGRVLSADLDGDGKADLIALYPGVLGTFTGNGDGTFQTRRTYSVSFNCTNAAVIDLNGDGHADVVLQCSETLAVLMNNGDGTLAAPAEYPLNSLYDGLVVRDFNGDGKPDVIVGAVANGGAGYATLLNNGDGTFAPKTLTPINFGTLGQMSAADLDNDGKLDLVAVDFVSGRIRIYYGNGDGTFIPEESYPYSYTTSSASPLILADIDGDGDIDACILTRSTTSFLDQISVIRNLRIP